ncbi:MAG: hypothetical protein WCW67_07535 [Candidatus Margulisiibacteriota bacterium]|jgi:hypothetical protein
MTIKKVTGLVILGATLFGLALVMGGCGSSYWDEVIYTKPNWTPEGLIYATKTVYHHREYGMGTNEYLGEDTYYVTMDTDGNNETATAYDSYPYYSPKGTYVAFISGETIKIVRRTDNQQIYVFSPVTENISQLDWGPDEDKLVYVTSNNNTFSIRIDGTNNTHIYDNSLSAIWVNTNTIAFEDKSSTEGISLSVISENGANYKKLRIGYSLQKHSENQIFYNFGEDIRVINLDGTNDLLLFSSYKKSEPKLSPDKLFVVGGKGYDTTGNGGIWIINIDGTNLKQLK